MATPTCRLQFVKSTRHIVCAVHNIDRIRVYWGRPGGWRVYCQGGSLGHDGDTPLNDIARDDATPPPPTTGDDPATPDLLK